MLDRALSLPEPLFPEQGSLHLVGGCLLSSLASSTPRLYYKWHYRGRFPELTGIAGECSFRTLYWYRV